MGLIELTKSCPEMHIYLRSWTVSSSQWLSTVSISRSIFPACGTIDIEQSIIRIRLYREGGRYVESTNNKKGKIIKKREKGKRIQKRRRRKRKRKREDTCTIADEQPSTLGVPDFRKVLGYRSP
jgi:hypothetical protein